MGSCVGSHCVEMQMQKKKTTFGEDDRTFKNVRMTIPVVNRPASGTS